MARTVLLMPFDMVDRLFDRLPFDWLWVTAILLSAALVALSLLTVTALHRVELLSGRLQLATVL